MKYLPFMFLFSIVAISVVYPIINESGNDTLWRDQGLAYYDNSQYTDALSAFHRATRINGTDDLAWTGEGYSLIQLRYYDEAITAFNKALEINPDNFSAWDGKVDATSAKYAREMN